MLRTPTILGVSMVQRSHRRWFVAVAYAALLTVVVMLSVARYQNVRIDVVFWSLVAVILVSRGLFGSMVEQMMLTRRWGEPIGLGLSPAPPKDEVELDEREQAVRNAAYFEAYRVLAVYCVLLFPFLLSISPERLLRSSFERFSMPLLAMLLFGIAWTLPQAIILWSEPDVPEDSRSQGRSSACPE